jgi:hypothetical protein
MGFPFETVTNATQRNNLMKKVLNFFDKDATPPTWSGQTTYTTNVGGWVTLDLRTLVTGTPAPSITLLSTLDSTTGEPIDENMYAIDNAELDFQPAHAATYTFTFRAENSEGTADQSITVTATGGIAPVWTDIPDQLVDLDADILIDLHDYITAADPAPTFTLVSTDAPTNLYAWTDGPEGVLVFGPSATPASYTFTFTAANIVGTTSRGFDLIVQRLDTDADGIPDWWETLHFGGPTNAVANADSDGDGFTNLDEYRLGTDPNDVSSYFRLQAVPGDTDGETWLYWPSATGLTYTIYTSTNLLGGLESFIPAFSHLPADPPDNILPVSPTNPATFYLLQVD